MDGTPTRKIAPAPSITIDALASQFWARFLSGAYAGPDAAAEALLGILNKVYTQGSREDVRTFLRSIKEQLAPASTRIAAAGPVFALAGALAVAAERLRQFSPVKGHDKLGSCVLEELRLRLYRVITGETFADDTAVRRHALDCCFVLMMKEGEARQRCQQRGATGPPASPKAPAGSGGAGQPQTPQKAMSFGRIMSERMSGLAGPDTASWGSLWTSLMGCALGHQAMPLLQSVLMDLYASGNLAAATSLGRSSASLLHSGSGKSRSPQREGSRRAGSGASDRSQLSAAAAAVAACGDDLASQSSDGGAAAAAHTPPAAASAAKVALTGAAAAFAGRFAAAASGARARMARLSDGGPVRMLDGRSRDSDPRGAADATAGPPISPAAAAAADALGKPGVIPADGESGGDEREHEQDQQVEQQPEGQHGSRRQHHADAEEGHAGWREQRAQAEVVGAGSTQSVPKGWVQFGAEPLSSSQRPAPAPTSGCLELTASSCTPGAGAAEAAVAGTTMADAAVAALAAAAAVAAPSGPCHHRRTSSRTLQFWADDSAMWPSPKDDVVADTAVTTLAH